MESNELLSTPGSVLVAGIVIGIIGLTLFLIAKLVMKIIGLDINDYADETRYVRDLGFFEQSAIFFSDARNIPVTLGIVGLFFILIGFIFLLVGGIWYISLLF